MGKRRDNYPPVHCLDEVGYGLKGEEEVVKRKEEVFKRKKGNIFDDYYEMTLDGFKVGRKLL